MTEVPEPLAVDIDRWSEALAVVARHYRLPTASEQARRAGLWRRDADEEEQVRLLARGAGLRVRFLPPGEVDLTPERLPLIVKFRSGGLAIAKAIDDRGNALVTLIGEGGLEQSIGADELANATSIVIPRPAKSRRDARVDAYIRPFEEHWLRRILMRDIGSYSHVLIASLLANLLALSGVIFSMQIYDRVIPAQSYPTLYILFGGVLLAIGFDFLFRRLRLRITDILGKRADLRMSDEVFGRALRVRSRDRPTSTGAFIAQLRDLEQVRDLLTSSTVSAVVDLPFFLLFLVIFWFIAGPLAFVPLIALLLLLVPGLLAQRRLRAYATESMRESSLRNAMLVEAVQGHEDIKLLQAEPRFQQQWNHYNAAAAEAQVKLRGLTGSLTVWTQNVQSGVYAAIVFAGAPLVMAGDITTGVLVAASILGSRMIAPVSQISQILNRVQQAKVGIASLDQIMALPVDDPGDEHRIEMPVIAGGIALRGAVFRYADPEAAPALIVTELAIAPGEKIAILGRNGAGKSTLLQGCSGLLHPASGDILLDGIALGHIDPADVRRDVGFLAQNSRLFHGTIRENLTLGRPEASSAEIIAALEMVGADGFIKRSRAGLEQVVQEGGLGLSGGQIQALLLARTLIREPQVVLLDEPTAAMDEGAERLFIDRFAHWSQGKTLLIATHRMRVLDLVDRVIVVQDGRIVLDKPKADALRTMQGKAEGRAA